MNIQKMRISVYKYSFLMIISFFSTVAIASENISSTVTTMKHPHTTATKQSNTIYSKYSFHSDSNSKTREETASIQSSILKNRKGEFFFTWGYNRSVYTKSDLHLSGIGYDITMYDVKAYDSPSDLGISPYLTLSEISIPQFNFHVGYFITDKWSLSVGWDHMKYVMENYQKVNIDGHISPQISSPDISTGSLAGDYHGTLTEVKPEFLLFEHTDGLNYASVEADRLENLWISKSGKMGLSITAGIGAGVVIPRSDVRLFTVGKNNLWNLAGFGLSAKNGIRLDLLRNIFLQFDTKAGYINLSDIHTTGRDTDGAKQHFFFLEFDLVLGVKFPGVFLKKLPIQIN